MATTIEINSFDTPTETVYEVSLCTESEVIAFDAIDKQNAINLKKGLVDLLQAHTENNVKKAYQPIYDR